MPELIEQTVSIGVDAYGRRVTMKRQRIYDGKTVWTIHSEPTSQRDEGEHMTGLTDENVRQMVDAVKVVRL